MATAIATGAGVALGDSVALPKLANRVDRHMMAGKEGVARGGSLGGGEVREGGLGSRQGGVEVEDEFCTQVRAEVEGIPPAEGRHCSGGGLGELCTEPRPSPRRLGGALSQALDHSGGHVGADWKEQDFRSSVPREQEDEEKWLEDDDGSDMASQPLQKIKKPMSDLERFVVRLQERGVTKVAFSGLRNGDHGGMKLPLILMAPLEAAQLLFLRCSEGGAVLATSNFYLARACGMQIIDARFLSEWNTTGQLPDLADFGVFSSCGQESGVMPKYLQPLNQQLFSDGIFCVLGNNATSTVVEKLIKRLGGKLMAAEEQGWGKGLVYTLSDSATSGVMVYHYDWILDSTEMGLVLDKERFVLRQEEEFCSQVEFWKFEKIVSKDFDLNFIGILHLTRQILH